MSDAQRTMTGAEHCVYCGDFFECRDHVIPVRYSNVRRDYRRGSTVHCCNRCNGLLGSVAHFTVEERARFLIDRYRVANRRDLTFPDWSAAELALMSARMQRAILGRLAKRTLIRLKIDNLERVCLEIEVEPISPLVVRGRRVLDGSCRPHLDGTRKKRATTERERLAMKQERERAERDRTDRAARLRRAVARNYARGILYWEFQRGPVTVAVVNLGGFRLKYGIPPNVTPPTLVQAMNLLLDGKPEPEAANGWRLKERVLCRADWTVEMALLRIQRMVAGGMIDEP